VLRFEFYKTRKEYKQLVHVTVFRSNWRMRKVHPQSKQCMPVGRPAEWKAGWRRATLQSQTNRVGPKHLFFTNSVLGTTTALCRHGFMRKDAPSKISISPSGACLRFRD